MRAERLSTRQPVEEVMKNYITPDIYGNMIRNARIHCNRECVALLEGAVRHRNEALGTPVFFKNVAPARPPAVDPQLVEAVQANTELASVVVGQQ